MPVVQAVMQPVGPQRTQHYAAFSKSKEVIHGPDSLHSAHACVMRAVPPWCSGSAPLINKVSWGWQAYSNTCRWWLSATKVNFQSPARCFKLGVPHF